MPDRLLTPEQLSAVKFDMGSPWGLPDRHTVGRAIMEAQDAKTASIKDAECQKKLALMGGCPWKEYKNGDIGIRLDKNTFNEVFYGKKNA